jgi:hypothetical protein
VAYRHLARDAYHVAVFLNGFDSISKQGQDGRSERGKWNMTEDKKPVILEALLTAKFTDDRGDIIAAFRGDDGRPYTLRFARGVVGALTSTIAILIAHSAKCFGYPVNYQSMTLNGASVFQNDQSRYGLELILDHGAPFGVLVPPEQIPALRATLERLASLQSGSASDSRPN